MRLGVGECPVSIPGLGLISLLPAVPGQQDLCAHIAGLGVLASLHHWEETQRETSGRRRRWERPQKGSVPVRGEG